MCIRTERSIACFLGLLLCMIGGCRGAASDHFAVQAMWSQENAALSVPDLVGVMRQAGFGDDEIIEFGPDLRNALAVSGGARISNRKMTRALFMVSDRFVYCGAVASGTFRVAFEPQLAKRPENSRPHPQRETHAAEDTGRGDDMRRDGAEPVGDPRESETLPPPAELASAPPPSGEE